LQCTRGDTLFAGTSFEPITVTVNVANNAAGNVTNTATVSGGGESNTANDTASDPTQIDAVLALTAQTTSASVTAGAAATSVLNVTANGAGLGAITFACSGLPSLANCNFSPSSVTASGQVTLTITTTASSTVGARQGPGPVPPAFYFGLLGFLGLVAASIQSNKKLRLRLAAGFACLALIALAGCGSNTKAVNTPGTPTGTFAVVVTASSASGGATAASTVNLTVH